ncbi:MAG: hypothetical protein OEL83_18910 [Desulforhopalus sp.]|nr:hypothetical protein [Desulforhopalus sp.]
MNKLIFCLIIFLVGWGWQSDEMKRGVEWFEIKKYDKAIEQFLAEIEKKPKSEEARYYLAKSYLLGGGILGIPQSLKWKNELKNINSKNKQIAELDEDIRRTISEKLKSIEGDIEGRYRKALIIAEDYGIEKFIDELPSVIVNGDSQDYKKAIELLVKNLPGDKSASKLGYVFSLDTNLEKKLYIAQVLWNNNKDMNAANYIKEVTGPKFLNGNSSEVTKAYNDLKTLPSDLVKDLFLTTLKNSKERTIQFVHSIEYLISVKDNDAGNYILSTIEKALNLKEQESVCGRLVIESSPLASFSNLPDSERVIRTALNVSATLKSFPWIDRGKCMRSYVNIMGDITKDNRWNTLPLEWHGMDYYGEFGIVGRFLERNLRLDYMFETPGGGPIAIVQERKDEVSAQISKVKPDFLKKYTEKGVWANSVTRKYSFNTISAEFASPEEVSMEGIIQNEKDATINDRIKVTFRKGKDEFTKSEWLVYDFHVLSDTRKEDRSSDLEQKDSQNNSKSFDNKNTEEKSETSVANSATNPNIEKGTDHKKAINTDNPIALMKKQTTLHEKKPKLSKDERRSMALKLVGDTLERGKNGIENSVTWEGENILGVIPINTYKYLNKYPCREYRVISYEYSKAVIKTESSHACRIEGKWYPLAMLENPKKKGISKEQFYSEMIGKNW